MHTCVQGLPHTQPHQFGARQSRAHFIPWQGLTLRNGVSAGQQPLGWAFASPLQGSGQAASMGCRAHSSKRSLLVFLVPRGMWGWSPRSRNPTGVLCLGTGEISQFRNQTSPHKALEEQREEKQNPRRVSLMGRGRRDPSSESCPGFQKDSRATRCET